MINHNSPESQATERFFLLVNVLNLIQILSYHLLCMSDNNPDQKDYQLL